MIQIQFAACIDMGLNSLCELLGFLESLGVNVGEARHGVNQTLSEFVADIDVPCFRRPQLAVFRATVFKNPRAHKNHVENFVHQLSSN